MKNSVSWLFALVWLLTAAPGHAEIVELAMPGKLVAQADFRSGEAGKPAVILLHGFLQTHAYPTVRRLADTLAGEGYTVLTPTLSLGVPQRRQSLACEAIHTHSLEDGVAELAAWVKWLKARRPGKILLAGHSMGSLYVLGYMSRKPDADIAKVVGISIVEGSLKIGEAARPALVQRLRTQALAHGRDLVRTQLSFCTEYRSSVAALLSYVEWGPDRILEAINQIKVPVSMIMGSKDDLLGKDWLQRLKKSRARVRIIEGANHFMDGPYEFDLVDLFLAELQEPVP